MKTIFDYATVVALSIGFAATLAGIHPLAALAFASTVACGVAALNFKSSRKPSL